MREKSIWYLKDGFDVGAVRINHADAIINWYDRDGSLGGPQKPYVSAVAMLRDGGQAVLGLHVASQADADAMAWLFAMPPKEDWLAPADKAMVEAVRSVPYKFIIANLEQLKAA